MLLGPAVARAATLTYAYTGTVTNLSSNVAGTFAVGDTLTGTLVLDMDAPAVACGSACAEYRSAAQVVAASIGSYGFSGVGLAQMIDLGGSSGLDYWLYAAGPNITPLSGAAVNGLVPVEFGLGLDSTGAALVGLSLVPPVFSAYQSLIFTLSFGVDSRFATQEEFVYGTLTSLRLVEPTPTTAPEPASLVLLGTGLVICSRRLAQSRRRRS